MSQSAYELTAAVCRVSPNRGKVLPTVFIAYSGLTRSGSLNGNNR
jgi:hypothetical protein